MAKITRRRALVAGGDLAAILGVGGGHRGGFLRAVGGGSSSGSIRWETASDWDSATAESGVAHERVAHTDNSYAGLVRQGYSYAAPHDGANTVGYWPFQGRSVAPESWRLHDSNPVIQDRRDMDWIRAGDTYYLYTFDSDAEAIEVWTSSDGTRWSEHADSPVLTTGSSGAWDDADVRDPSIERDGDGTFYLYYSGSQQSGQGTNEFGVATAPGPTGPFTKSELNPILSASSSGWDSSYVTEPHVRIHDGTFEMTYTGTEGSGEAIGHASSSDGISFVKDGSNPIYDPGDINDQCNVHANGEWHLFYTDKSTDSIEKVVSSDLSSFSAPESQLVSTRSSDYSPAIRYDHGAGEYRMYWHGLGTRSHINLATTRVISSRGVHDLSGNGLRGTATDVKAGVRGVLGTAAFRFNGSSSVVKVDDDALDVGAGPLTLSAWVKKAADGQRAGILAKNRGSTANYFVELQADDTLRFQIGDSTDNAQVVSSSTVTASDGWTHVVAVATGAGSGDLVIAIDGVEDARTSDASWNSSDNDEPLCIGAVERGPDSGGPGTEAYLSGDICDPRVVSAAWGPSDWGAVYDVVGTAGWLTTAWRSLDVAATELATTTTVPANTSIDVTVDQDTNGDGTADNRRTVSLGGGTDETNALSGFDGSPGRYRVVVRLDQTDVERVASLYSVEVSG